MQPIDTPTSECYGCTAGMCDHQICRGDQYFYNKDHCEPFDIPEPEVKQPETIKKDILVCELECGWTHDNPNEWHHYERATNGNLFKVCGWCTAFASLKTILIEK